jgi:hypothetical protein
MTKVFALALLALSSGIGSGCTATNFNQGELAVFTETTMEHLRFLEGRWSGTAPDSTIFY